jgi:hypothetical protein
MGRYDSSPTSTTAGTGQRTRLPGNTQGAMKGANDGQRFDTGAAPNNGQTSRKAPYADVGNIAGSGSAPIGLSKPVRGK